MHKRLTLAAVTAAGILAIPSIASADTTCTFDPATHTATMQLNNPQFGSSTILRPDFFAISFADGTGGFRTCMAPDGINFANPNNTDKIVVKGSPSFEQVELNEGFGFGFGPGFTKEPTGKSAIQIQLFTGSGGDILKVVGTPGDDAFSAYGSQLGGQVDLDNDGDTDVAMTNPARIILNGGLNGKDRLAAMSVFGQPATLPVTLDGGDGDDTLFGGSANDLLLGGNGNDFMNAVGGGPDVVAGLDGTDTAFVDASDTVSTVESQTIKVGTLSGSKETVKAAAGAETALNLAWTHPKAWKDLKSIKATMFDGAKAVGTITLTPAGKVSSTGEIAATRSTIGHHGKTVTAKLGFKVAPSLKGHTLSVDIAATDKAGRTQTENAARSIALR